MLTLDNFYKIIKVQHHTDISGSYNVIIVDRFIEPDRSVLLYEDIFIKLNISGQCIKSSYNFLITVIDYYINAQQEIIL